MKQVLHITLVAVLTFGVLYGAEAIGYSRGVKNSLPEPTPNLATTLCYQMGQELSELSPSADIALVRARAQAVCVKP